MTEFNPITFNTSSIGNSGIPSSTTQNAEEKTNEEVTPQVEDKNLSATENLNYLEYQGILAMGGVQKSNNNPAVEARIGAMMAEFEEGAIAGLARLEEEMGAVPAFQNLSEADKLALGAELFTSQAEW